MSSRRFAAHHILPPICLLLALTTLIAAFALWNVDPPEASVELHQARTIGDEQYSDLLEAQLARRQWAHIIVVGCLFASSVAFTLAAFWTMRPREIARAE